MAASFIGEPPAERKAAFIAAKRAAPILTIALLASDRKMDIKQKRQDIGLSRIEMADAMGVNYNTLSKWERGEQKPPAAAVRLARLIAWLVAQGDLARAVEDITEDESKTGEE